MSHSSNNVDLGHPEKTQDEVLEVIQYTPATAKVGRRPRPSGVRHQLAQPWPEQRDWNLDKYCAAIREATDAALEITGAIDLSILCVCAGGCSPRLPISPISPISQRSATSDIRIRSASLLLTTTGRFTFSAVRAVRERSWSATGSWGWATARQL
jgi:poly(3-hydroxyalkanoate) synthetase